MRAAYASRFDADDPLAALTVGDAPSRHRPDGLGDRQVRASSLNHHDLWSLRGVGPADDQLPMILGCDAAGIDPDGNEVVIYPVVPDPGDPRGVSHPVRALPGHARRAGGRAPDEPACRKPAGLSFADAACLPTAWLTA